MLIPVVRDNGVQIYTGEGTKDNYLGCLAEPVRAALTSDKKHGRYDGAGDAKGIASMTTPMVSSLRYGGTKEVAFSLQNLSIRDQFIHRTNTQLAGGDWAGRVMSFSDI
jgi:hypothetical protein